MNNGSMCPYFTTTHDDLITHLVRRHRHAADFIVNCSANGCGRSFKNYLSFKTHVRRCHLRNPSVIYDPDLSGAMNESHEHDLSVNTSSVGES